MKKLLITFLVLIPVTIYCQNTDSTKTKKFAIGLTFSPDYCFRTLSSDESVNMIADQRNDEEIPKFGYTTGLNIAWKLSNRFTLETGVLYSNKGEKTKKYTLNWYTPNGQNDPALGTKNSYTYSYIYLDIPVKVNFYFLTKKTKLYLTAGISPNIFLSQKTTSVVEFANGEEKKTSSSSNSEFQKINLTFIVGFGVSYDFSNKLYLKIEPTYRQSITSIIDAPVKSFLYSAGLNTGLYFKL